MDQIVITGVSPYDGSYPLDIGGLQLTTREWGWIKRLTGYLPLTVGDGFAGGDPELYASLAVIALRRAGKIDTDDVTRVFEKIGDAPFGATITLQLGDRDSTDEDDAGPPPPSSSSSGVSSGDASTNSSETSPDHPNGSGTPASASSGLHPIRSGT